LVQVLWLDVRVRANVEQKHAPGRGGQNSRQRRALDPLDASQRVRSDNRGCHRCAGVAGGHKGVGLFILDRFDVLGHGDCRRRVDDRQIESVDVVLGEFAFDPVLIADEDHGDAVCARGLDRAFDIRRWMRIASHCVKDNLHGFLSSFALPSAEYFTRLFRICKVFFFTDLC
jgi:hypothetical protein